ncbi:AI-2E family transporter [Clostridium sp. YIM B02515]|uniref:AI-2E family transporter n=1 Tax=Clostridium rhizosphaerae TaxID=2803861 RepID=A0ABS1T6Z9_9CLOT|nr:AI-2E family transporter [Clostridium rhizosphaerae]MBL4935117.1 AI-2E family transporter [Clostridium rhizosphaerae]
MKKVYKYSILFFIILAVIIVSTRIPVVKEVYSLILISFIISYSLRPIHKAMVERGINNSASAIIIILLLALIAVGGIVVIIPSIFRESLNVNTTLIKIQAFIENFYERLKPVSSNKTIYAILDIVYSNINKVLIDIFNKMFKGVMNIGGNLLSIAVVPIVVYYFLSDGDTIGNRVLVLFPTKARGMIKKIWRDIDKILGRYILSQFLLCAIIGIFTFIILLVLKVDYPIILSLLNALFNIIPYFGPLFGAIPAILVAFLSSTKTAIWTAVWLYLIQQIEGNIISPKITGDSVSMHPVIVIILLIIGGKIGGFIGMVLAIPVGVIIKVVYEDLNYYMF